MARNDPHRLTVLSLVVAWSARLASGAGPAVAAGEPPGEGGPDRTRYERRLLKGEGERSAILLPVGDGVVVDLVVAAGLAERDHESDSETSIAVDPRNPERIVVSAFSGGWGARAPLWSSEDGGGTWRKVAAIPAPPRGVGLAGCPCDQTLDFGAQSALFGSMLAIDGGNRPTYSGGTSDPGSAAAWLWNVRRGTTRRTNPTNVSDQPWIVAGPAPDGSGADAVYVAYTDYGAVPPANHVAAALGGPPPRFARDAIVGTAAHTGFLASAALRVAVDPTTGALYALWQDAVALDPATCARSYELRLSRSTDGGSSWGLDAAGGSLLIARRASNQGRPDPGDRAQPCAGSNQKFGAVNALLGGVDAVAVDAVSGDVYVVFGSRDAATGNNRLEIARLAPSTAGGLRVVATQFLTGQVQAALPAVAVAANGTVGVLYDSFDGVVAHYPRFTTHLAQSVDRGATFVDQPLATFLSPARGNPRATQRVLGDYQQMKAVGNVFYAAFPANGAAAGRSISGIDPFFAKVPARSSTRGPVEP